MILEILIIIGLAILFIGGIIVLYSIVCDESKKPGIVVMIIGGIVALGALLLKILFERGKTK